MVFTPYSTARPLVGTLESWIPVEDQERRAAYTLYEQMYWNAPDVFKLVQRGSESSPIYIPSPRTVVEATNRFLAKRWDFVVNPRVDTPQNQIALRTAMNVLFKRETMWTKFATQKRFGLIRGDAVWHVVADNMKPEGSRISIYEVDPASYFPIWEDDSQLRRIGCHLIDVVEYGTKTVVKRLTYRKDVTTGIITTETALFEQANWDDRQPEMQLKKVAQLVPPTPLPATITSIPVYHVRNFINGTDVFGSSELRGFERLFAAVNQTVSDQDLAIALDGLGLYFTTSGPPTDEDGNEVNWRLGPGRVVEGEPESDFKRVSGLTSLPGIEHMNFILDKTMESVGVPRIATGSVDVQLAESGVALYMHLSPLLAKNEEKEQETLGVMDHMLYDLSRMWLPTYEGVNTTCEVSSVVADPMPVNRKAKIDEIIALATCTPPIISAAYARQKLIELGYEFPDEMGVDIVQEQAALAEAQSFDPFANRVNQELQ